MAVPLRLDLWHGVSVRLGRALTPEQAQAWRKDESRTDRARGAGLQAVAELYRPYGDMIVLDRCRDLAVHHDPNTGVVVLEYASQGRVVPTGTPYANRYISVLTIADVGVE